MSKVGGAYADRFDEDLHALRSDQSPREVAFDEGTKPIEQYGRVVLKHSRFEMWSKTPTWQTYFVPDF